MWSRGKGHILKYTSTKLYSHSAQLSHSHTLSSWVFRRNHLFQKYHRWHRTWKMANLAPSGIFTSSEFVRTIWHRAQSLDVYTRAFAFDSNYMARNASLRIFLRIYTWVSILKDKIIQYNIINVAKFIVCSTRPRINRYVACNELCHRRRIWINVIVIDQELKWKFGEPFPIRLKPMKPMTQNWLI